MPRRLGVWMGVLGLRAWGEGTGGEARGGLDGPLGREIRQVGLRAWGLDGRWSKGRGG